jgi:hypothetical protein
MQMKKAGFYSGWLMAVVLMSCAVSPARGQGTPNKPVDSASTKVPFVQHYYHLVFVVKEMEGGKVINSREYGMSIGTVAEFSMNYNNRSIRTGTKVPLEGEQGKATYIDVGVNIDCRNVMEVGGRLAMDVSAEVSSVGSPKMEGAGGARGMPIILQNRWNSQVLVTLGKPTVLFASDEVTSKRTLELELTATELK